jgi:hypothetical protein
MGFYLRKSINVGPLRFNLSKNGVGVSAGIKGLRISTGPRGNHVYIGRNGLYYRKTLPPHNPLPPTAPQQLNQPVMEEIESGPVSEMTDSSATELLGELNSKHKQWNLWKIAAGIGAALAFMTSFNIWTIAAFAVATILAYWYDQFKKTTVLFYDFEPEVEASYQVLHDGFEKLKSCNRIWHISAKGDVDDPKYHAGANTLVNRKIVTLSKGLPPYVKSNIEVPVFPAGKQVLYFFPERILVYESARVGAIAYTDLNLEIIQTQFVESESLPQDAKVIDRTWRYTNKSGGPDRRFKNNRELPVVLYNRLMFTSPTGLREHFATSALDRSEEFSAAIQRLKS